MEPFAGKELAATAPAATRGRRLARRGTAAAAVIPDAVFFQIGEIPVAGPEDLSKIVVCSAVGVAVSDEKSDRCARRLLRRPRRGSPPGLPLFLDVEALGPPGLRRSSSAWMSPSPRASLGGQPSMTAPMAFPCDSPNVVTLKSTPKVLPGHGAASFSVSFSSCLHPSDRPPAVRRSRPQSRQDPSPPWRRQRRQRPVNRQALRQDLFDLRERPGPGERWTLQRAVFHLCSSEGQGSSHRPEARRTGPLP